MMYRERMSDIGRVMGSLPRIHEACRSRGFQDEARGRRLTDRQVRTLLQLDGEDPVMVTELADFLGVTPSTMSLNLKRLEEGGLIRRSRDPEDRRVMNVLLTEEGVEVSNQWRPYEAARVAALLQRLRPDQRLRAVEGLALLAEAADGQMAASGREALGMVGRDADEAAADTTTTLTGG